MPSKNIDTIGRLLRLATATVLLIFAWWESSWLALALAAFVFYEALASWCVLYWLLGKNSCPLSDREKDRRP